MQLRREDIAELAYVLAWDAVGGNLVPRSNPTLSNMPNGSALVVWPWDAVP